MNGGDIVKLSYNWSGGVGFTGPSVTPIVGTARFNVVKLWSDEAENIILKDGNTGNLYAYNLFQFTTWVSKAIGFDISGTTNADPNAANLKTFGPFKLINCQN
jgi:hypothetical protein